MSATNKQHSLRRILPLYGAAYMVLLCGLGAYLATTADDRFGVRASGMVTVGLGVSLLCRQKRLSQNTVFGILMAVLAAVVLWVSAGSATPAADLLNLLGSERTVGPGAMLAWFVVFYSFAMITDEVIVFSVVPSIALLGLMASENLNPEIGVYFLGLVLSAVFLLVYDNLLGRISAREASPADNSSFRADGLRAPLLLATGVLAVAVVLGLVASIPLRMLGAAVWEHSTQLTVPASAEFALGISGRYINQVDLTGAPPHLTDRVVMKIASPRSMYWRGSVFDEYTGYSWASGAASRPLESAGEGLWRAQPLRADPASGEAAGREPLRQFVRMLDPLISGTLFCAAEPVEVAANARVSEDRHRCLRAAAGRTRMRYAVVSMVSVATPRQLMRAGDEFPMDVRITNLQVTDEGQDTRLAIARQVTNGLETEYEKVKALETYLRTNFEYTLTPPRTPPDADAVAFFLTQSKVGYCEAFASAMTVLCRELGIPARMVTGFAPGEASGDPSNTGDPVWILRERDLHAWTEVYFPRYGWITFDPTSSQEARQTWASKAWQFVRGLFSGFTTQAMGPLVVILLLCGTALLTTKWLLWDALLGSMWWRSLQPSLHPASFTVDERWDALYARAHRQLRRRAGSKRPSQTAFEYAAQARGVLPVPATDAFDELTALYVRGSFQRGGPSNADFQEFRRAAAELKQSLKANS